MVTVIVIGILAAVALPSFSGLINRNRVTSDTNSFLTLLLTGRSEAIKRNRQVVVCKSADGATCSSTSSVTWDDGVVIFVDDGNGGGTAEDETVNGGEVIIRADRPLSLRTTITGVGALADRMIYRADGRTYTASGEVMASSSRFDIVLSTNSSYARQILVSANGRPRIQ